MRLSRGELRRTTFSALGNEGGLGEGRRELNWRPIEVVLVTFWCLWGMLLKKFLEAVPVP